MNQRWQVKPPAPAEYFTSFKGLPPLIAQLLYNRGLRDGTAIRDFLTGDTLNDPALMPGIDRATARLETAISAGEMIAVYGDYDLDGISATALLVTGLERLGAKVIPHIPHRLSGGYGLKTASLKRLQERGCGLVVSVDCGITAVREVAQAWRGGLDIIITDHHTPLAKIPDAVAILNPKLKGSRYPFAELTGVGVAFSLLRALFGARGREAELDDCLDLVALGTVADIAPLVGENRVLVRRGLKLMNETPRAGIRAMIESTKLRAGELTSESIGWVLAPRLNAAGRLVHAMASYNLLITGDETAAADLATKLDRRNRERQQLTVSALSGARELALAEGPDEFIICADASFAPGVVGLVAGRLCEEFYRPSAVVSLGEKTSHGSCRSIPEFNIVRALDACRELLEEYGGHAAAAGFTVANENLPALEAALKARAAEALAGVELMPSLEVDMEVPLADLSAEVFRATAKLAPFGEGNPLPVFLSRWVPVTECLTMGADGAHLRLKLDGGGRRWEAVAWRQGGCSAAISKHLDIVYNLETDYWNGEARQRLNILDLNPG